MRKYRQKTPAANIADKLLRLMLAAAAGLGWFVYLWGLSLPAICAGLAFGALIWLCARLLGKKSVERREKQMRRMIGGELALERLLLQKPRHAAFQAAIWLTPKLPLRLHMALDWGVTGTLHGKPALMKLIAQHESVPVTAQQLVAVARETRERSASVCVVCATAPYTRDAEEYARTAPLEITLIKRDELAALAGLCSPATDEDLSRLTPKRGKRRTAREWASLVLDPNRARRYLWYGVGMALLAFVTGQWVYPLPAVLCLGLFAGCKVREMRASS